MRVTKPIWNKVHGVRTQGGSARWRSQRLGLHEEVLERFFQNWPLRPRVPVAVYHRSIYGHVHTKRASATRAQSCDFHPSGRHRGVPRREFLSRVENFWRMHRRSEKLSGGPISGNGGVPKSRMHAQACPLVTRPRLGDQKIELEGARLFVPHIICICHFLTKKSQDKVSLRPYPGDAIEMSLSTRPFQRWWHCENFFFYFGHLRSGVNKAKRWKRPRLGANFKRPKKHGYLYIKRIKTLGLDGLRAGRLNGW